MDIGDWLRGLGLAQYEPAFRDNAIDGTVLPNLTAEDLKEIGVAAVGHRRRLLGAIAALRAEAPLQLGPPMAPLGGSSDPSAPVIGPQPTLPFPSRARGGGLGRREWGRKPNAAS